MSGLSQTATQADAVRRREPPRGIGLALSGGGFRAMLFHCGALLRLIELGLLPQLRRLSSVSGGSITAGLLAMKWPEVVGPPGKTAVDQAADFCRLVLDPLFAFSARTIDAPSIVKGVLNPFSSAALEAAATYDKALFDGMLLADLPDAKPTTVIICATNLSTGSSWTFSRLFMQDYRIGRIDAPRFLLSQAVAASAGFPPVLAPLRVDLSGFTIRQPFDEPDEPETQVEEEMPEDVRRRAVLADGGVYDNHGLEPVLKNCATVLVSDAGMPWGPSTSGFWNWVSLTERVSYTTDNQVRSLRRRQLVDLFLRRSTWPSVDLPIPPDLTRDGAYWGMRTNPSATPVPDMLDCPHARIRDLATTPTRLTDLGEARRRQIVNWGYAACDVRVRRNVALPPTPPPRFPYDGGLG